MANKTETLELLLPLGSERPDIRVLNKNFQTLDNAYLQEKTERTNDVNRLTEELKEETERATNRENTIEEDLFSAIGELSEKLGIFMDSDDDTLNQLSELIDFMKNNKIIIDNLTEEKVNVSDIVDNVTSTATNKPLSAKQGKILKDLIDALTSDVSSKVSGVKGDKESSYRSGNVNLTPANIGALPLGGGTITGDLRLKGSGNYGNTINFGDDDYVHIKEPTDDCLEIKAKKLNLVISDTSSGKFTINNKVIPVTDGTDLFIITKDSSGNWGYKAGGADTFYPFKGSGVDVSDATLNSASKLLSGYIAYGKDGTRYNGSMTDRSGKRPDALDSYLTGDYLSLVVPEGYYDGTAKVEITVERAQELVGSGSGGGSGGGSVKTMTVNCTSGSDEYTVHLYNVSGSSLSTRTQSKLEGSISGTILAAQYTIGKYSYMVCPEISNYISYGARSGSTLDSFCLIGLDSTWYISGGFFCLPSQAKNTAVGVKVLYID